MILPVTLTTAAAAGVINLWLAFRIVPTRLKDKVLIGDAGDTRLQGRMRAHANFTEYAPIILILMGGVELAGGSPTWLWAIGIVFVLARIAHAVGMDINASNPWRAGGALLTWAVTALLAGWAIASVYGAVEQPRATVVRIDATAPRA